MTEPFRFRGGVAVVTGAASGIGTGLVKKALSEGMKVVAADVRADALDAFVKTLSGMIEAVPTDVGDPGSVERLAARAYDAFGRVDVLFNNAGIMATGFSWEIEAERWARSLNVNIMGVVNGIRSFVPRMLKAGGPGHVVNTASIGGFLSSPLMAPYSGTKFAVVGITESLRAELELIQSQIGVSLLAPGPVKTGIFDDPFGKNVPEAVSGFVDMMRRMLTQDGLTPEAFADRVFEGIQKNQFWLLPQPEVIDKQLANKTEGILARRNPRLPKLQ